MNFHEAWSQTQTWEGEGYHEVEGDPGGATKYGISKRSYPWLHIPSLTFATATAIALTGYWQLLSCDELPPRLRWQVFDTGFNQGPYIAALLLQRALNLLLGANLLEDGILGPKTLQVARRQPAPNVTAAVYRAYRIEHYLTVAETSPHGRKFIYGWLRRAEGGRNASS